MIRYCATLVILACGVSLAAAAEPADTILRGDEFLTKGETDKAIDEYNQALKIDPKSVEAYQSRALAWLTKNEFAKALADYDYAIRLNPNLADNYCGRALAFEMQGKYKEAVADYVHSTKLNPQDPVAPGALAWHWAACSDPRQRDGKRAVDAAQKACELTGWKQYTYVAALAAGYAESGGYTQAVKWQESAIAMAPTEPEKAELRKNLEEFKAGRPVPVPTMKR